MSDLDSDRVSCQIDVPTGERFDIEMSRADRRRLIADQEADDHEPPERRVPVLLLLKDGTEIEGTMTCADRRRLIRATSGCSYDASRDRLVLHVA